MAYFTSPWFTVEEEELVQCHLLEARVLDQTYCSPAISVYRTNGIGHPMVRYNRARIVLYGDIVRAPTAMSISFAVVQRPLFFGFPFYQNPKGESAGIEGV